MSRTIRLFFAAALAALLVVGGARTGSAGASPTLEPALFAAGWDEFLGLETDGSSPRELFGEFTPTDVSFSIAHACFVDDGAAYCWGNNDAGQLGDGTTDDSTTPVQVLGLASGVTDISAGDHHTCAISNGAAFCWGMNTEGQLGSGSPDFVPVPTPAPVSGLGADVTAISAGWRSSCAVQSGAAFCWGANDHGQLGDTTTDDSPSPVAVDGLAADVSTVSVGGARACAIQNGSASCWGVNVDAPITEPADPGDISTTPVPVPGLGSDVTDISSSVTITERHTCAVQSGAAFCWGSNTEGQLGDGTTDDSTTPVPVTGLGSDVTAVSAGGDHSCAIQNGSVFCWGANGWGQAGDGTTDDSLVAVPMQMSGAPVSDVSAGWNATLLVAEVDPDVPPTPDPTPDPTPGPAPDPLPETPRTDRLPPEQPATHSG